MARTILWTNRASVATMASTVPAAAIGWRVVNHVTPIANTSSAVLNAKLVNGSGRRGHGGPGRGLPAVGRERHRAANRRRGQLPRRPERRGRGVAQQGARGHAHERVQRVPHQIEHGNLVRHEFDEEQRRC